MDYQVSVEAQCYGDVLDDVTALTTALKSAADGMEPEPLVQWNDERLLRTLMVLDAMDAEEAHDTGMEVWREAWSAAFDGLAATAQLAVSCRPLALVPVDQRLTAAVAEPGEPDDLADLEAELEAEEAGA